MCLRAIVRFFFLIYFFLQLSLVVIYLGPPTHSVWNILKCSIVATSCYYQSPKLLRLLTCTSFWRSHFKLWVIIKYYLDPLFFLPASRFNKTWLFQGNTQNQLNYNPWKWDIGMKSYWCSQVIPLCTVWHSVKFLSGICIITTYTYCED